MKIQKFSEIYYVPKSDNPTSVSTCHGIHRQCDITRYQSNILVPMEFFFEKCWGCQQHCKNLTWYSGIEIIWYKIQYMRKLVEICDMAQPISHFLIQCHAKYYTTEQATPSLQSGAMDPGGGGGTLLELEIFLVKRKICKIILFQHPTGPLISQNRSFFSPCLQ